jgi:hypothetical protein
VLLWVGLVAFLDVLVLNGDGDFFTLVGDGT